MERERQERLQTQAEIDSAYQRSLEEDRRKVRDSRITVFHMSTAHPQARNFAVAFL
jgi:hypothetical protein